MEGAVPLPHFKGPKLEPFPFKNPLKPDIALLEELGWGAHSRVFKVRIEEQFYALKMVWPHAGQETRRHS